MLARIPRSTYARTHARTLRKRAKTLSRGRPRVYLAFPQFCARFLLHIPPRAGVCRRADGSHRGLQRFANAGCLEWYIGNAYYHGAYLAGADMSSSAWRPRQRVHTKSRTRPTLQRQRVYRRRPAVRTKCTSPMRLMAILFYAWRFLARDKNRLHVSQITYYPETCVNLADRRRSSRSTSSSPLTCGKL